MDDLTRLLAASVAAALLARLLWRELLEVVIVGLTAIMFAGLFFIAYGVTRLG